MRVAARQVARPTRPPALVPALLLALGLTLGLTLGGCDGSNLFAGGGVTAPPPAAVDARAEVLRYLEEALLLGSDDAVLRFRWTTPAPRLLLPASLPPRERDALRRAAERVRAASGPDLVEVTGGSPEGAIRVDLLEPDAYRAVDPTRPWSFSRTFVTATPETGITAVRIALSAELEGPVLERAALHAMGHAIGLMGHPAFPGGTFVMAASPDGAPPPTAFHPWEEAAIRFLYSPAVFAGMTRTQLREAWRGFVF